MPNKWRVAELRDWRRLSFGPRIEGGALISSIAFFLRRPNCSLVRANQQPLVETISTRETTRRKETQFALRTCVHFQPSIGLKKPPLGPLSV